MFHFQIFSHSILYHFVTFIILSLNSDSSMLNSFVFLWFSLFSSVNLSISFSLFSLYFYFYIIKLPLVLLSNDSSGSLNQLSPYYMISCHLIAYSLLISMIQIMSLSPYNRIITIQPLISLFRYNKIHFYLNSHSIPHVICHSPC